MRVICDTNLCQLYVAVNRFTVLMMSLKRRTHTHTQHRRVTQTNLRLQAKEQPCSKLILSLSRSLDVALVNLNHNSQWKGDTRFYLKQFTFCYRLGQQQQQQQHKFHDKTNSKSIQLPNLRAIFKGNPN